MLEKFQIAISPQPVVRSTACFVLGGVFGDGGSNGVIFDSNKFKMAAAAILDNFEWPYLRYGSRFTYLCDSTAFLLIKLSLSPLCKEDKILKRFDKRRLVVQ